MNKETIEKLRNFIPTVPIDLWPIPPSCIQDLLNIAEHSLSAQDEVLTDAAIIDKIDRPGFAWENLDAAEQRNLLGSIRELLAAAAPSPAVAVEPVDDDEDAYLIERLGKLLAGVAVALNGPEPALTRWSYHDLPEKAAKLMLELEIYRATPSPSLAVRDVVDEVSEREAFEAMVKERFVTTEHSLARAHPYGYYNTVRSDTFGGRRQPDYANVQMLWDVWDARATIAKKAMREKP